jgi:hypothetical protein
MKKVVKVKKLTESLVENSIKLGNIASAGKLRKRVVDLSRAAKMAREAAQEAENKGELDLADKLNNRATEIETLLRTYIIDSIDPEQDSQEDSNSSSKDEDPEEKDGEGSEDENSEEDEKENSKTSKEKQDNKKNNQKDPEESSETSNENEDSDDESDLDNKYKGEKQPGKPSKKGKPEKKNGNDGGDGIENYPELPEEEDEEEIEKDYPDYPEKPEKKEGEKPTEEEESEDEPGGDGGYPQKPKEKNKEESEEETEDDEERPGGDGYPIKPQEKEKTKKLDSDDTETEENEEESEEEEETDSEETEKNKGKKQNNKGNGTKKEPQRTSEDEEEIETTDDPVEDPFADEEDIPDLPLEGGQQEARQATLDDIIKQLKGLSAEGKRGAIAALKDLLDNRNSNKNESLNKNKLVEAVKNIREMTDDEFGDYINSTYDLIDQVSQITYIDDIDARKTKVGQWAADPLTAQELQAEDNVEIQKDFQKQKAREKEKAKYNRVGSLEQFKLNFYRAINNQVEILRQEVQSYAEINPEYESEDIIMKADIMKELPDEAIPIIDIYFDVSSS